MDKAKARWGVGRGLRLFMWACFVGLLVIGGLLASGGERASDRVGGWVILAVTPVLTWLTTLRPYIEQTSNTLEVQNPLRFHRVPPAEVRDTALLNTGLGIRLSDGRQVVAWALNRVYC
jgi:hypothetical protein